MDWLTNPATYAAIFAGIGVIILIGDRVFSGGRLFERISVLQDTIKTINKSIDEIRNDIKDIFGRLPAETFKSNSPRTLTDLGKEISENLKASDWAEEHSTRIFSSFQDKQPYEIDRYSFEFVEKIAMSSLEFDKTIQQTAYERGISTYGVKAVFAIELRDAILSKLETIEQGGASSQSYI